MAQRDLVPESYVPALLAWINGGLTAEGSQAYRRLFGIGIAEWHVLAYLGHIGVGTGLAISKSLYVDKAAVSRSIASLKRKKLVRTVVHSRRNIEVFPTEQGMDRYRKILRLALLREKQLLKDFSPEERAQLIEFLHRLLKRLPDIQNLSANYRVS
ncbi:MAG TPA: MarR family winged helix-turn-helix transcriptional regulator [Xanthobacteraceae bacterium]|nr:MarR family winged helix-turn-helix transcriptional regulator [Xanthobacteraceae bacterium]